MAKKVLTIGEISPAAGQATVVIQVVNPKLGTTKKGDPFFQMDGRDSTDTMEFRQWLPNDGDASRINASAEELQDGVIAVCRGTVDEGWKRSVQMKNFQYQVVPSGSDQYAEYAKLVLPSLPAEEIAKCLKDMKGMLGEITYPALRVMCLEFLSGNKVAIESTVGSPFDKGHHGYIGGYAKHILGVMRLSHYIAGTVPESIVDKDLVVAGSFLHDIGKFDAYSGLSHTMEGRLLGHIVPGVARLSRVLDGSGVDDTTAAFLAHIVTSHHSTKDWGSPVPPSCIEAEIVSHADLADSHIEVWRMQLEKGLVKVGAFSEYDKKREQWRTAYERPTS